MINPAYFENLGNETLEFLSKAEKLKKEKNAVVLAHFYEPIEIQLAADFVGDSLELARRCKDLECEKIVFCGVSFMAETAKLLCPEKCVFIPAPDAGCLMADMIDENHILRLREEHPHASVVCYINSTARTKAVSDICCTSANAVKVASAVEGDEIIFVPDRNLGRFVAEQVPQKKFFFHPGYCPIHDNLKLEKVLEAKAEHPGAPVLTHPECQPEICALSDFVGSTSQILRFVAESEDREFIICTEDGVIERMRMLHPEKTFFNPDRETLFCEGMKKITPEMLIDTLENGVGEVFLDEGLRERALRPIERMLEIK